MKTKKSSCSRSKQKQAYSASKRQAAPRLSKAMREALAIIGPKPIVQAARVWRRGWHRLEQIAPQSKTWNVGVRVAAILSLAEGRPGINEFWADVQANAFGWPTVLRTAIHMLSDTREGRDPILQAEAALSAALAYCAHQSEINVTLDRLMGRRQSYARYRVRALQATFIGLSRVRKPPCMRKPSKASEGASRKQLSVKLAGGNLTSIKMRMELYEDACEVVGDTRLRELARSFAGNYRSGRGMSALFQERLCAAIGLDNEDYRPRLKAGDGLSERSDAERRAKHREANVKVWIDGGHGEMRVTAISRALYDRAVALMQSPAEVNVLLREAADRYVEDSPLGLAETVREALMEALCRHPDVEAMRLP